MLGKVIGRAFIRQIHFDWAIIVTMQNEIPHRVDWVTLATRIREWARELGFQAVGISDTDLSAAETRLVEWLSAGLHGELDYMAKHGSKRSRPGELVQGTLRVISLSMNYFPLEARDSWQVLAENGRAYISRYALGRDYHKVMRDRLKKLAKKIRVRSFRV